MFGYVLPSRGLDEAGKARYQGAYCGLCRALGRRCGFLARFTLNYDFTFLAILFAPAGAEICPRRCFVHPFRPRSCCAASEGFDLAAEESVILFRQKLADDVADKGFFAGLPARLAGWGLNRAYRRAARARPEFDAGVREGLDRLRELEEENCPSMDKAADTFAGILRAAVPPDLEGNRARVLRELLYHLGRWIYLADAWDDLEEDRKTGNYNPLLARFDGRPEEEQDYIRATLTHSVRLCQAAFQLEEFGAWTPVLEDILYRGLPGKQEETLAGERGTKPPIRAIKQGRPAPDTEKNR